MNCVTASGVGLLLVGGLVGIVHWVRDRRQRERVLKPSLIEELADVVMAMFAGAISGGVLWLVLILVATVVARLVGLKP